jgi:hypothetical protein
MDDWTSDGISVEIVDVVDVRSTHKSEGRKHEMGGGNGCFCGPSTRGTCSENNKILLFTLERGDLILQQVCIVWRKEVPRDDRICILSEFIVQVQSPNGSQNLRLSSVQVQ